MLNILEDARHRIGLLQYTLSTVHISIDTVAAIERRKSKREQYVHRRVLEDWAQREDIEKWDSSSTVHYYSLYESVNSDCCARRFQNKNSYLCTYDLYGPVRNVLVAGRSITRANWRGLGPKRHSPIGSMPFHRAQKTLDFQGPTPLPLAQVMDLSASKIITYRDV
jgi:hypothetical protein